MKLVELKRIAYTGRAIDLSGESRWAIENLVRSFGMKLVAESENSFTGKINGVLLEDNTGMLMAVIGEKPHIQWLQEMGILGKEHAYDGIYAVGHAS